VASSQASFSDLGATVFERGWLSSNNIVFSETGMAPATVLDTGYAAHAEQTVALVQRALGHRPLGRIVNSHLHSDHCGGNALLQATWRVETWVPERCLSAVTAWDEDALSYRATDQRCERFVATGSIRAAGELPLGPAVWEVHAAPGHDPTALMFFEPVARVLISADALWEKRLAIIFPELVGEPGFDDCLATLDTIERLQPRWVIPGHGSPFSDVAAALAASRSRVEAFARDPARHRRHAIRSLVMFHAMELVAVDRQELLRWLTQTPIAGGLCEATAAEVVDGLVGDGALVMDAQGRLHART
jgi:glyoxylase-like metal-dependent hydrolase (beta-lactamase superfamily II)